MRNMMSRISPKGQMTIPAEIRECLGIKAKDRVLFRIEGNAITIEPVKSALAALYQSVRILRDHGEKSRRSRMMTMRSMLRLRD